MRVFVLLTVLVTFLLLLIYFRRLHGVLIPFIAAIATASMSTRDHLSRSFHIRIAPSSQVNPFGQVVIVATTKPPSSAWRRRDRIGAGRRTLRRGAPCDRRW